MKDEEISTIDFMQDIVTSQDKLYAACRICKEKETEEHPLCVPCYCRGDLRYVHEDCMLEWIKRKNEQKCEFCGYEVTLRCVYKKDIKSMYFCAGLILYLRYMGKKILVWAEIFLSSMLSSLLYFSAVIVCFYTVLGKGFFVENTFVSIDSFLCCAIGWIVSKVVLLFAEKASISLYVMLFSMAKKVPVGCSYEDIEFTNASERATKENKKESAVATMDAVTRIGLFTSERIYMHKSLDKKSVTPEEICDIFSVILFEEDNLLQKKSNALKNIVKEVSDAYTWTRKIIQWKEKSRLCSAVLYFCTLTFFCAAIFYVLIGFPISIGLWIARQCGKVWRYVESNAYICSAMHNISARPVFIGIKRSVHKWKIGIGCYARAKMLYAAYKEAWVLGNVSIQEKKSLDAVLQNVTHFLCGITILTCTFWINRNPYFFHKKKCSGAKRFFCGLYIAVKIWVLCLVEYVALPVILGYLLVASGKHILKEELALLEKLFYAGNRVFSMLAAYYLTGYGLMQATDMLTEKLLMKVYRPGLFYWICLRKRNVIDRLLRERLFISLLGILQYTLQVLVVILCMLTPLHIYRALPKGVLSLAVSSNYTWLEPENICKLAYFGAFLWQSAGMSIKKMIEYAIFRGTALLSRKAASFFQLDSVLYDDPLPHRMIRELHMLKYLPAKSEVAYRTEEVVRRMGLQVSLSERMFYFDDAGRKRKMYHREKYLDKEEDSCTWPESLIYATRDQILLNPSFSVYYVPGWIHVRLLAYVIISALGNILCSTLLLISASIVWNIMSFLSRSTHLLEFMGSTSIPFFAKISVSLSILGVAFSFVLDKKCYLKKDIARLPLLVWKTKEVLYAIGVILFSTPLFLLSFSRAFPFLFADLLSNFFSAILPGFSFPYDRLVGTLLCVTMSVKIADTKSLWKRLLYLHFSISLFIYVLVDALLFRGVPEGVRACLRVLLVCFPGIFVYSVLLLKIALRIIARFPKMAAREIYLERIEIVSVCRYQDSTVSK